MKKFNAILALLTILSLLGHTAVMTYSLMTGWYNFVICHALGGAALLLLTLHAALSIIIVFFCHEGSALTRHWKLNIRTILQRGTGLLLILVIHMHMNVYGFIAAGQALTAGDRACKILLELLFAASLMVHVGTSFSKALITLGWLASEDAARRIDRVTTVVVVCMGIVYAFAIVRFFMGWMA